MPKAKTKMATANSYATVGSDEARVQREAAELAQKLAPAEAGEFGLEIIDGAADNVDGAANAIRSTIAALQTLPFFGGGKLVWLKSANFLSDDVRGKSVNVLEPLQELGDFLSSGLPNDVTFLVSAIDPDKRRSFYKTLTKLAEIQFFDEPDLNRSGWQENAGEVVRAEAKKRGLEFEEEALELFVLSTGGDSGVVANELEKLALYAPEGSVTAEQVRALVPISRAAVIFELGNALARRDPRTQPGARSTRSGREGHRHFARDHSANRPQSSSGEGPDGTSSPPPAASAICLHFNPQSSADERNRTFATKKRWHH